MTATVGATASAPQPKGRSRAAFRFIGESGRVVLAGLSLGLAALGFAEAVARFGGMSSLRQFLDTPNAYLVAVGVAVALILLIIVQQVVSARHE